MIDEENDMKKTMSFIVFAGIAVVVAIMYFFPTHSFDKDYAHAASLQEPFKAYEYLKDAETTYENDDGSLKSDELREMALTQFGYLISAIEKGDKKAIEALYEYPDAGYDVPYIGKEITSKVEILRQKRLELAPRILEEAKTSTEISTLNTAASILDKGEYATRDVVTASAYLASAWSLGDGQASNKVALLYNSIKDTGNAYLWSLRCIGQCNRSPYLNLSDLEKQLAADQTIKIQKLAADKSMLQVNG